MEEDDDDYWCSPETWMDSFLAIFIVILIIGVPIGILCIILE